MTNMIKKFAEMIKKSKKTVALTGAGMSTAAGIPDFRGKNGIYQTNKYDPMKTFDLQYFKQDPSHFYRFAKDFLKLYDKIAPTFGHKFLAELEANGNLAAVITQNIDNLHQLAGSKRVLEFHGSFNKSFCLECGKEFSFEEIQEILHNNDRMICECGGFIKPDVVFFGEQVKHIFEAEKAVIDADLMIILGSSLTVQPAAFLPYYTNADIVVINKGEVAFPRERIELFFEDSIDEVLRELKREI